MWSNVLTRKVTRCKKCHSYAIQNGTIRFTKAICDVGTKKRSHNALYLQYNKAFRMLMEPSRRYNASGKLAKAFIDDFTAIMR